jgi:hypothetical protein
MEHIWCFVIHYAAEKIGKKIWRSLKSRAAKFTNSVVGELQEMIGLDRTIRKIAIGLGLTLFIAGTVVYVSACQDRARVA